MNPTDIPSLYYASERPSRQLLWQRSRNATGLCGTCGHKPVAQGPDGKSRSKCLGCILRQRKMERRRKGWKAQVVSGRGRPALFSKEAAK